MNQSVVTGGNKTLLFNAEFYINIGGPVRVLGFYDAGQVQDIGQSFALERSDHASSSPAIPPLLTDPFTTPSCSRRSASIRVRDTRVVGKTPAFKTSTGVEVRFFMPVLNVPFRLIAAYNPSRRGVLNNNLQPTPKFTFRFAVGTTF